ncbi:MAG: hypothetical protein KAT65_00815, partial [Methanophagales archaeon]|nr:hypothetical protein [Methanophagales archaeon]
DKGLSTAAPKLPTKRLRWVSMESNEKTLAFALIEIDRMACALKLPNDIKEATSLLYRKAAKQNLIKGRSIEELTSAMIYITCRQYGVPRTLKEIVRVSKMDLKKIRKAYSFLKKKLDIRLMPAEPSEYVPRFCSELGLSDSIREKAIKLLKENSTISSKGGSPVVVAASAIYVASGGNVDINEIAKVAGTTSVSILNNTQKLI